MLFDRKMIIQAANGGYIVHDTFAGDKRVTVYTDTVALLKHVVCAFADAKEIMIGRIDVAATD